VIQTFGFQIQKHQPHARARRESQGDESDSYPNSPTRAHKDTQVRKIDTEQFNRVNFNAVERSQVSPVKKD